MELYIDGSLVGESTFNMQDTLVHENISVIIGFDYESIIDRLSIGLETKSSDRILWHETVPRYYPFDGDNNN